MLEHELDREVIDKLIPDKFEVAKMLENTQYFIVPTRNNNIYLLVKDDLAYEKAIELVEKMLREYEVPIISKTKTDITVQLTPETIVRLAEFAYGYDYELYNLIRELIDGIFENKEPKEVLTKTIEKY